MRKKNALYFRGKDNMTMLSGYFTRHHYDFYNRMEYRVWSTGWQRGRWKFMSAFNRLYNTANATYKERNVMLADFMNKHYSYSIMTWVNFQALPQTVKQSEMVRVFHGIQTGVKIRSKYDDVHTASIAISNGDVWKVSHEGKMYYNVQGPKIYVGKPYHVCMTFNTTNTRNTLKVFIDGIEVFSRETIQPNGTTATPGGPRADLVFGKNLKGHLWGMRTFKGALTQDEIVSYMDREPDVAEFDIDSKVISMYLGEENWIERAPLYNINSKLLGTQDSMGNVWEQNKPYLLPLTNRLSRHAKYITDKYLFPGRYQNIVGFYRSNFVWDLHTFWNIRQPFEENPPINDYDIDLINYDQHYISPSDSFQKQTMNRGSIRVCVGGEGKGITGISPFIRGRLNNFIYSDNKSKWRYGKNFPGWTMTFWVYIDNITLYSTLMKNCEYYRNVAVNSNRDCTALEYIDYSPNTTDQIIAKCVGTSRVLRGSVYVTRKVEGMRLSVWNDKGAPSFKLTAKGMDPVISGITVVPRRWHFITILCYPLTVNSAGSTTQWNLELRVNCIHGGEGTISKLHTPGIPKGNMVLGQSQDMRFSSWKFYEGVVEEEELYDCMVNNPKYPRIPNRVLSEAYLDDLVNYKSNTARETVAAEVDRYFNVAWTNCRYTGYIRSVLGNSTFGLVERLDLGRVYAGQASAGPYLTQYTPIQGIAANKENLYEIRNMSMDVFYSNNIVVIYKSTVSPVYIYTIPIESSDKEFDIEYHYNGKFNNKILKEGIIKQHNHYLEANIYGDVPIRPSVVVISSDILGKYIMRVTSKTNPTITRDFDLYVIQYEIQNLYIEHGVYRLFQDSCVEIKALFSPYDAAPAELRWEVSNGIITLDDKVTTLGYGLIEAYAQPTATGNVNVSVYSHGNKKSSTALIIIVIKSLGVRFSRNSIIIQKYQSIVLNYFYNVPYSNVTNSIIYNNSNISLIDNGGGALEISGLKVSSSEIEIITEDGHRAQCNVKVIDSYITFFDANMERLNDVFGILKYLEYYNMKIGVPTTAKKVYYKNTSDKVLTNVSIIPEVFYLGNGIGVEISYDESNWIPVGSIQDNYMEVDAQNYFYMRLTTTMRSKNRAGEFSINCTWEVVE